MQILSLQDCFTSVTLLVGQGHHEGYTRIYLESSWRFSNKTRRKCYWFFSSFFYLVLMQYDPWPKPRSPYPLPILLFFSLCLHVCALKVYIYDGVPWHWISEVKPIVLFQLSVTR